MSMNIELMRTKDPNNKVVKTTSSLGVITGNLKEDCSIIDPVITIDFSGVSNFFTCNYAYIPEFNRYYHVRDITVLNAVMAEIRLHVDVLTSFSAGLLNAPCIVSKNESRFNLYINDPNYKCQQQNYILMNQFPSGFPIEDARFVVACLGSKSAPTS